MDEPTVEMGASPPAPARMDRERIPRVLGDQRRHCEGRSPFYVEVLRELEEDAASGPGWLLAAERAWKDRSFAVGWEAAHLLLACLHFHALQGDAELAEAYPSCGGSGKPGGRVKRFLARAPAAFWERLRTSFVQTNEVDRSAAWMLAAAGAFARRGLPFHLVELGTSAGLNLIGDHLPHACTFVSADGGAASPPKGWDSSPHPILTRAGLDIRPRRLSDEEDRLWLKACVWADDRARLERLDRAVRVFLDLSRRPGGPRLERCSFLDAPEWLARHRRPKPGEGLLVFNSIATIYLGHEDYAALREGMAAALAPWDGRGYWVEFERARGETHGPLDLLVHRAGAGGLESRVLGTGAPRPQEFRLRPGWEFLHPEVGP